MDLAQATQALEQVAIAGRSFSVRQLKLREWGALQSWLKQAAPSTVAVALKGLAEAQAAGVAVTQAQQDTLFAQAQEEARGWPPRVGTTDWLHALEDLEGGRARFLQIALAPGTELGQDEAAELVERATLDELAELMRICLYGEHLVPKAEMKSAMEDRNPIPIPTNGAPSSTISAIDSAGPTLKSAS